MVLNPALFAALKQLNRGVEPKVTNAGLQASFSVLSRDGKPTLHGEGEHYAINCPCCTDTRSRLYVHYMFGQVLHVPGFNQPGDQLLMLAYCQNEQKRIRLIGYLEGHVLVDTSAQTLATLCGTAAPAKRECPSMGTTTPLQDLPENHQAAAYLTSRGFNYHYLGSACGAVLMHKHSDPTIERMSQGRIGFPFYVDGVMKLWQARSPYDLEKGKKWPPKWWFPGGTAKVPWNVDVAAAFPVVILCEGILSAVNTGPAGIAIGGKTMTPEAIEIIKRRWKRAFVMLDPDAGVNRKPTEKDYHQMLIDRLTVEGIETTGAKWVRGDNRDPGDLGFAGCLQVIKNSDMLVHSMLSYGRYA